MDINKRLELIKQVGEEIITEEELKTLLQTKTHPIAYDGFEPSGQMHIAQGLLRTINVNKMIKAGVHFKMWVADWFAWMNNKMGGDLEKIRTTGKYFIEVWKACGMETDKIDFVWAKDVVTKEDHWKTTIVLIFHNQYRKKLFSKKNNKMLSDNGEKRRRNIKRSANNISLYAGSRYFSFKM